LNRVVTLLTDFGLRDEYVGVMKGVILRICPGAAIVDLSHQVAAFDVLQGGLMLRAAFRHFPPATVHLAVIDPGVGSGRALLAAEALGQRFVGPDNGVLAPVLALADAPRVVRLDQARFLRAGCGDTFHGRDILAPVAAHMAAGVPLEKLGVPVDPQRCQPAPWPPARAAGGGGIEGRVLWVDHFGSLVTSLDTLEVERLLAGRDPQRLTIAVGGRRIRGLLRFYAQAPPGGLLALMGSRGLLEVSVNGGDAGRLLGIAPGAAILATIEE
jgi:hypothetical protein